MELVIAVALFVGTVGSWLFLPSVPPAEKGAHGAAPVASKA